MRISRSFTVPAGNYDVFVVAKEPTPDKAPKNAPPPKMSVLKQTVTVPDFWNGELTTSSVIVAQRIDPLPAPLTPQQQAERPYALGTMEIVPAFDTKFTKKAELSTFMLIYNPKIDSANKPDVSVEYNFYAEAGRAAGEVLQQDEPADLNAQTLPPQFDFAAGHQLQSGQAVPLASFPEGDYRLEIKVTDKLANKSLTRDVNFTVSAVVSAVRRGRAPGDSMSSTIQIDRVGGRRRSGASVRHRRCASRAGAASSQPVTHVGVDRAGLDSRRRPGRAAARRSPARWSPRLARRPAFAVTDRRGPLRAADAVARARISCARI